MKRQQQRLDLFEKNAEFDEILSTYNNQMLQMEADNNLLLVEIRRIIKVDTNIATLGQKPNADLDTAANVDQLREQFDRIIKSQKCTIQSVTK